MPASALIVKLSPPRPPPPSSSYDNKVKLWDTRDYECLKTMEGHEGRVMGADVSDDGKYRPARWTGRGSCGGAERETY